MVPLTATASLRTIHSLHRLVTCKNNESLGSIDHKNVNARKNNATSLKPNLNAVAPTNGNQQKLTNEQPVITSI